MRKLVFSIWAPSARPQFVHHVFLIPKDLVPVDEMEWSFVDLRPGLLLDACGFQLYLRPPSGAVLVSGNLHSALKRFEVESEMLGTKGIACTDEFALRLARDRALLVSPEPREFRPGWHSDGFAVTPADDVWKTLDMRGERSDEILTRCMSLDLAQGSVSAAIVFNSRPCLLTTSECGFLLMVESAFVQFHYQKLVLNSGG